MAQWTLNDVRRSEGRYTSGDRRPSPAQRRSVDKAADASQLVHDRRVRYGLFGFMKLRRRVLRLVTELLALVVPELASLGSKLDEVIENEHARQQTHGTAVLGSPLFMGRRIDPDWQRHRTGAEHGLVNTKSRARIES